MPTQLSGSIDLSGSIFASNICALTASWSIASQIKTNNSQYDSSVIIVPKTLLYNDANDDVPPGSTNLSRTSLLQGVIDSASAYYTSTGRRATLVFPSGSVNINEMIIMPNLIYSAEGDVYIKKAENATASGIFGSLARTRRMHLDGLPNAYGQLTKYVNSGIVAGSGDQAYFTASYTGALYRGNSTQALPTGSITRRDKCINAVLSFTQSYENTDNVYGASDNITFTGPGKFIFTIGTASVAQPILLLREVRDFTVHPGAIEVHHCFSTSSVYSQWGIRMGGRNITWYDPIVKKGLATGQDGFHIAYGKNIRLYGGYIESGDDSIAIGSLNNGPSNVDPDEPAEDISIVGTTCMSMRSTALVVYVGMNMMNAPYTPVTGSGNVRRVQAINLNGNTSRANCQSAFKSFYDTDLGRIYRYRIVSSGSGYPIDDDFVCNVVPSGSGGSGAQAVIRVESGSITYAWPRFMSNVNGSGSTTWANGSTLYQRDSAVDLSPLGITGSTVTGSVLGIRNVYSNSTIEDIYVSGKFMVGSDLLNWSGSVDPSLNIAGTVGGTQYAVCVNCGRRIELDLSITFDDGQNAALGGWRALDVSSGEDIKIKLNMTNPCARTSTIRNADSSSATDRITIVDSNFYGITSQVPLFKGGGSVGSVCFNNCTCRDIPDNKTFIDINNNESGPSTYAKMTFKNCTFMSSGSLGTGRWMTLTTSSAVSLPCIGKLIVNGCDFSQATGSTSMRNSFNDKLGTQVLSWDIKDNIGLTTYVRKIVTIPSGSTSSGPISSSTETGFPSASMSSSAGCVTIMPMDNNTTATMFWRSYDPSSKTYTINTNGTASAGGYNFTVIEDTSIK